MKTDFNGMKQSAYGDTRWQVYEQIEQRITRRTERQVLAETRTPLDGQIWDQVRTPLYWHLWEEIMMVSYED